MLRVLLAAALLTFSLTARAQSEETISEIQDLLSSSKKFTDLFIPSDRIVEITPMGNDTYAVEMFYYRCTYMVKVEKDYDSDTLEKFLSVGEITSNGCER